MGRVFEGRREALTYRDWRALGWDKQTAQRLALDHEPGGPREVVEAFLYCDGERLAVNRPVASQPGQASATRRDEFAFEWGYAGSGPHETARAILGVLLLEEPVGWLSQQFKRDVIAARVEQLHITEQDVGAWAEWTLASSPPPSSYPEARAQLEKIAAAGARARREARERCS